jgi:hypothetical protein
LKEQQTGDMLPASNMHWRQAVKRATQILTFSAAVGASLLAASAYAQQPAAPPPAARAPATTQATPIPQGERGPSKEDRDAYLEAHVAAVHAGLRLKPDQERLWAPVESAVRDMARQMNDLRDQQQTQAMPADPIEHMARMGDMASKRGQAMSRVAEAARPLYATLSDNQKRRLRVLMRAPGHDGRSMGQHMRRSHQSGPHDHRHQADGARGMHNDDMKGDAPHGKGRGTGRGDNAGDGHWNNWR